MWSLVALQSYAAADALLRERFAKAREWLGRAVRAPRDPTWTADGITATEWEPVSPVTGRFDAFEWKVPVSAVAPRHGDAASATNGVAAAPLAARPLPSSGT